MLGKLRVEGERGGATTKGTRGRSAANDKGTNVKAMPKTIRPKRTQISLPNLRLNISF